MTNTHLSTANIGRRALVTGASSGIGAAIARELAAQGVDLVLTARRRDALEAVAVSCKGVKVEIITADLGQSGAAHALWADAAASGPIDILINNAGFGYFRRFDEVDWARDAELVQLNMTSLVALARCFVNAHKGGTAPAHMMNIASTGAYQSVPNMALYAASKAFVRNFSEALHDEHIGTSLSVTCICPGGTETEFHAASGGGDYSRIANASMKSAGFVAHTAIRAMLSGKRTVVPGLLNQLTCFGVRFMSRSFASRVATQVLGKPRFVLPARSVS
jgi:short-subunit dehydrogenase